MARGLQQSLEMYLFFVLLLSSCLASTIPKPFEQLSGHELVQHLNNRQTFFKAELSSFSMAEMKIKAMKGEFTKNVDKAVVREEVVLANNNIPESFDARSKWPSCPTINRIYDQSTCGSCWAFASAEVMSDRYCIYSTNTIVFSPADILSCCTTCGNCEGGYPLRAFNYWVNTGVCTGGSYGSQGNCKPYQFAPCGNTCSGESSTPSCQFSCQQGYSTSYLLDRRYGRQAYLVASTERAVQKEIMIYGPVATCFDLYEDFYHYRSGVYVHTAGKYMGGHCVKVIGWGTEAGVPFWLAANSWNTTFGENGYFRIARGTAGVNFDEEMMAAIPKV